MPQELPKLFTLQESTGFLEIPYCTLNRWTKEIPGFGHRLSDRLLVFTEEELLEIRSLKKLYGDNRCMFPYVKYCWTIRKKPELKFISMDQLATTIAADPVLLRKAIRKKLLTPVYSGGKGAVFFLDSQMEDARMAVHRLARSITGKKLEKPGNLISFKLADGREVSMDREEARNLALNIISKL